MSALIKYVTSVCPGSNSLELVITLSVSMFVIGIVPSFGALFLPLMDRYNDSRSNTALVISLLRGLTYGCGVLFGYLIKRVSVEKMTVIGTILVSAGYIASFFSTTLIYLYITIGVVCGAGSSILLITSTRIMTRLVQTKNVPAALAMISLAPGTASICFPYLLDYLEQTYSLPGTFLILGGICLNSVLLAALTPAFRILADTKLNDITGTEKAKEGNRVCRKCFIAFIIITYVAGTSLVALMMGAFSGLWQDMFLEKKLSKSESFLCFICYTVMDTVGRALPLITKRFESLPLFSLPLFSSIAGFAGQLLLRLSTAFELTAMGSSLSGLCSGGVRSASSLVMFDILGVDGHPAGFGFYLTMAGVSVSVSGPIFGAMVDATSSYNSVTMTTSILLFASCVLFLTCLLSWKKGRKCTVVHE